MSLANSDSTETNQVADQSDQLIDSFGRTHDSLRISVTDQCNIRCFYCMPEEVDQFFASDQLLSFDEILRVVDLLTGLGVRKIRLTGGEPLLRKDLDQLISELKRNPRVDDLALTSNGILLTKYADSLKRAGLDRLNISLDTLSEEAFQKISRRRGVHRVIDGIDHAIKVGFEKIRLNALAIRGLTEDEILPLLRFSLDRGLTLRFIEYMPLDADQVWSDGSVLSGQEIRELIEREHGTLELAHRDDPSQPAVDYQIRGSSGLIGFINPVTQPFCDQCNRLRLTSDGTLRNCLFSDEAWDLRALLRSGASNRQFVEQIVDCVAKKKPGHLISRPGFTQPERAMYQIGG